MVGVMGDVISRGGGQVDVGCVGFCGKVILFVQCC